MTVQLKSFVKKLALGAVALGLAGPALAQEVNVYSYRQPQLVEPLFAAFTEQTGIKVNTLFAKKGMAERLAAEGATSPADVILTVDIGRLIEIKQKGLVQPVQSDVISTNVPGNYRDPDNEWFGLTLRTRLFYVSNRVEKGTITSYEDLADPKLEGRVCTRPGSHAYNLALIASKIAHDGEEATQEWLEGVKANLARKPQGNDRAQVKAVADGLCDVAVGNNYYYAKMLNNDEQKAWAEAVYLVFPNQDDRGAHVNISGMAMAKHAPNQKEALALMEFLTSDKAQEIYAAVNYEYPVKPGVAWSELVESWGKFQADDIDLAAIAAARPAALVLVNKVGFDN